MRTTLYLAAIAACQAAIAIQVASHADNLDSPPSRVVVLRNMPTNSDNRCLGIAVVAEALVDGVPIDGIGEAKDIAQRIYENLTTGRQLRFHRHVVVDKRRIPITSEAALEQVSTLVAETYKEDYLRLVKTDAGRRTLLAAERSFIGSLDDLARILDDDPDKMDAFIGTGSRLFANGKVEDTSHAFLIAKQADGIIVVFDPNDPGSPITCRLTNGADGVSIEWTCRYRNTGHATTQRYQIVQKDRFFQVMLDE